MFERATGCFENAGRRFLQDSKCAIRSRSSVPHRFRTDNGAGADSPYWFLALLQASVQQSSPALNTSNESQGGGGAISSSGLLPDFLCPRQSQSFVASRLSRSQKRPGLQRKKTFAAPSRPFISISSLRQAVADGSLGHENEPQQPETPQDPDIARARETQADLHAFLQKDGHQYDHAWVRYVAAGRPSNMASALCAYMSSSKDFNNQRRAYELFQQIPPEDRTKYDFKNILNSQLLAASRTKPRFLYSLCEQVVTTPFAEGFLTRVLIHHVENRQWARLTKLWQLLLDTPQKQRPTLAALLSKITRFRFAEYSLSRHLLDLADHLECNKMDSTVKDFARRLLAHYIKSHDLLKLTPITTLLDVLKKYTSLRCIGRTKWKNLIERFQSGSRSEFINSILLYRQFRVVFPNEHPPRKLLPRFIERLLEFQIPETTEYFLDELSHFYSKPSVTVYKNVMAAFSGTGDAKSVDRIFDRFLADHGNPKSRRIVAPVLLVHARLGDVPETLRQFQRISAEFGLVPNTVCWNILILAHANAGDLQGALSTFSLMLKSGEPPDSHTFGTLLALFSKRGDVQNVRRLITEAQKRQVKITRPMLDTAVQVYCNNGQLSFAEELAAASWNLAEGGSPLWMWNTILMQYAFRVSKFSFRRVLDRIGKLGMTPDAMTHGAIILAYATANQPDFARTALRRMHRMGLQPTQFHYSVVLFGYLKMRNRDMVHVILGEMETRFGRVGLSANLLNLKMQIQRDLENARDQNVPAEEVILEHAEKTILASLETFDANPSPAKHKSRDSTEGSALDYSTVMHYEHVIKTYSAQGATEKAFEMLSQFLHRRQLAGVPANDLQSLPFELVKTMMVVYLKAQEFEKVEECWHVLLRDANKIAGHVDIEGILASEALTSDLPISVDSNTEGRILPSRRFILDFPLTIYIRSLACREQYARLSDVIAEFQNAGFALTGTNWSNYISALASSENFDDNVESFQLFEEKFCPHFPGWSWMVKGYGIRPIHAPMTILHLDGKPGATKPRRMMGKKARAHWRMIEPDYMHPHYPTMVLLASTMRRIREASIEDGPGKMEALHAAAPKTFEILSTMPYLREKYQGALLRDKEAFENQLPLPIRLFTTRTGALGLESRPKTRTFWQAKHQPLDFEIYAEPRPVDEKNVTRLLNDPDSAKLGSLASILPRSERIDLETQHHEYHKLTEQWKKGAQRRQATIERARQETNGRLHGVPVKAIVKRGHLKQNLVQRHVFDKYYSKWKLKKPSYLLYKPISGLRERRKLGPYLKQRGLGRRRTKRYEDPRSNSRTKDSQARVARAKAAAG
ncbi:Tetratricopeptide-like helical [Penicillium soppii]|jgi:pentatricopeptide repeat-containing protein PET309|uniref:Tetratricopeptide-like helical n=1 Tax=Penicillium soppii TaxID=69789 RepID=UPI002547A568|nr:Tetratricopeptide-like helical [Penicillium soppii]KAJ5861011.1 Tetratricopeptide-like helical [Penicillium soppii]